MDRGSGRSAVLFADPFAIPTSGVVAVQEVRLLAPPLASLGLGENHRTSGACTEGRLHLLDTLRVG
jgi:hypothetical protein